MELNEPHGPADADLLAHLDTEERRKIEARVQKRLDYVGGLRALANAINDDPDLPLPGDLTAHRGFYGPDALDIIRAATRSLGSIEKKGNAASRHPEGRPRAVSLVPRVPGAAWRRPGGPTVRPDQRPAAAGHHHHEAGRVRACWRGPDCRPDRRLRGGRDQRVDFRVRRRTVPAIRRRDAGARMTASNAAKHLNVDEGWLLDLIDDLKENA